MNFRLKSHHLLSAHATTTIHEFGIRMLDLFFADSLFTISDDSARCCASLGGKVSKVVIWARRALLMIAGDETRFLRLYRLVVVRHLLHLLC